MGEIFFCDDDEASDALFVIPVIGFTQARIGK